MRKRLLGSIAALAAGAGSAWGQPAAAPPAPAGAPAAGPVATEPPLGGPGVAVPPRQTFAPPPAIMPPGNYGPAYDPLGLGPVGGFGPAPSPTYPVPGPYAQPQYQPAPGGSGLGYGGAPRWWVEGEYLLWSVRGLKSGFPLLTTSAPGDAGIIGRPSTAILSGGQDFSFNVLNGMRLSAGFFGDADRRFGFNITGHFTEEKPNTREYGQLGGSGVPVLARPFIDVSGAPSALVLSGPDFGAAFARVRATNSTFGIEPAAIINLYRAEPGSRFVWSIDYMTGYRFLQLKEELSVRTISQLDSNVATPIFQTGPFGIVTQVGTSTGVAQGSFAGVNVNGPAFLDVRDNFKVTNQFNGAMFGLKTEARYGMFTGTFFSKVSIGSMQNRIEIGGFSTFLDATLDSGTAIGGGNVLGTGSGGGAGGALGGVLANAGNIRTFNRDRFTAVPELGGNIGVALTGGLTAYVGANFIYFADVVRPGSLVNPFVNTSSIPGSANFGSGTGANPAALTIRDESFWIGGATFGLMLRY